MRPLHEAPVGLCSRCGSFDAPEALKLFRGQKLCSACLARRLETVRIWTPGFLTVIGTLFPPSALVLVMVDWWRLGSASRMLVPLGALLARVAAIPLLNVLFPLQDGHSSLPRMAAIPLHVLLNVGATWVGTLGLRERSRAHLAAGGGRASNVLGVVFALVLPWCCLIGIFMGVYQVFVAPPPH